MEKGDTMSRAQMIRSLELAGVIVLFSILFLFQAGGHHPAAAAERESGSGYTAWISGKDISVNKSGINTIEKSYYSRDLNKKAMKIYKALYKKSGKSEKKVKVKLAKKITVKLSKSAFKKGKLNDQKKVAALDLICDKATTALTCSNIDCYWINHYTWRFHYTYKKVSKKKVSVRIDSIIFKPVQVYKGAREDHKTVKAIAQKAAANIMRTRPNKTHFTTARLIYEYLIKLVSYGHNNNSGVEYSPAGALLPKYNHICVCDGYARAFKMICDYCNVPCLYVSSVRAKHAWNMVQLESGKWYGVDATWGDAGKTASLRWFMYGQNEVNNKEHPGDSDYMFGDESYDFAIPALEPIGIGYSGK